MQIDPNDIADLTTLIFAAALNPARWLDFLERLSKFSGGVRTHMFGRDMATGRLFGYLGAGYDDSHMVGYDAHYRHKNVWVEKFAPSPNGTYMPVAEMYPLDQLFKTEFYHDWVKPQDDMYGGGGVMLFNEQDRFLAFGGHIRAKDREKIEGDFERLVRMLTPHVQQAFEINRALDGKVIGEFVAEAQATTGLLLLRPDGRLIFANGTMQTWIESGAPFTIDPSGRVRCLDEAIGTFLERALRSLNDLDAPASATLQMLTGDGTSRLRLRSARFVPERQHQSPFGILHSGTQAALLVTVERKPVDQTDAASLLRQHRLSPTEIEVALDLANGLSVAEIAERRRVSVHTIRNQRHAIMSKLDLHRQSELVRMLSTLDRT